MPEQFSATARDSLAEGFAPEFPPWRTMADFHPRFQWEPLSPDTFRGTSATGGAVARKRIIPEKKSPKKEKVIEFEITRDPHDKFYLISAIDVNEKRAIDKWTASTEEEANSIMAQVANMFMKNHERSKNETPSTDLQIRNDGRQRGHLTRDDRMKLRNGAQDEITEDSFSLDIDEDAITKNEQNVRGDEQRVVREISGFAVDMETDNVPF